MLCSIFYEYGGYVQFINEFAVNEWVTKMFNKLIILFLGVFLLTACASNQKYVPRGEGYRTISYGAVVEKEAITIGGTNTGIGSFVGSAAAIQDATSNSFVGFVVRGLAGAIVGSAAEEVVTRKNGMLYTIETSSGSLLEIASTEQELAVGSCVRISHGRRHARVTKSDATKCHKKALHTAKADQAVL